MQDENPIKVNDGLWEDDAHLSQSRRFPSVRAATKAKRTETMGDGEVCRTGELVANDSLYHLVRVEIEGGGCGG